MPESISLDESFSSAAAAPAPPPGVLSTGQFDAEDVETVNEFEEALNSLDAPLPETERRRSRSRSATSHSPKPPARPRRSRPRSSTSASARTSTSWRSSRSCARTRRPRRRSRSRAGRATTGISIDDLLANSLNHRKEVNRIFELQVPRRELARGHQVTVDFRLENKDRELIGEQKTFSIELHARPDIEKLLLSLKFHIQGK